jgi:hypothetical protein
MRRILEGVAILVILVGLLWIGQGTGYFPHPHASFMIDDRVWAYRGAGLAIAGVIALLSFQRILKK